MPACARGTNRQVKQPVLPFGAQRFVRGLDGRFFRFGLRSSTINFDDVSMSVAMLVESWVSKVMAITAV